MADLDELYREIILDHYRNPRRRGTLHGPHVHAEGVNPSCGDEFALDLRIEDGVVTDVAIQGQGCSISQASGSMMAEAILGKEVPAVEDLMAKFRLMMGIDEGDSPIDPNRPGSVLGDLEALQGVRRFPVRIKCADLPWTTLADALAKAEAGT
ncbi:MAG TPA: SUF system NifU family Fe-S cluster assembly protein [Actinobacteria bacterium]|nr:SUF system NifU family Fe-S cluster assembly protein [Actinomycetota bacterium]